MATLSCYNAVKRTDGGARPPPAASYINAVFVGDRSGSMASMGSVPQEGVADFLEKHKNLAEKNPDSEIYVTVVTFDNYSQVAYSGQAKHITQKDIDRAKHYMFPRNTTRLIDTAIEELAKQAKAITSTKRRWHNSKTRSRISREVRLLEPSMASSFTLLTDGEDNESIYTSRDLNNAIKNQQNTHGTVCLFAAANQDAMNSGTLYGFDRDRSLQIGYNEDEARAAFNSCSAAAVRSATQQSSGYTQCEREASCTVDFGDSVLYYESDDYDDCPIPRATRC
jgi:hypothetical protein